MLVSYVVVGALVCVREWVAECRRRMVDNAEPMAVALTFSVSAAVVAAMLWACGVLPLAMLVGLFRRTTERLADA